VASILYRPSGRVAKVEVEPLVESTGADDTFRRIEMCLCLDHVQHRLQRLGTRRAQIMRRARSRSMCENRVGAAQFRQFRWIKRLLAERPVSDVQPLAESVKRPLPAPSPCSRQTGSP
jgi:hypothetical protein